MANLIKNRYVNTQTVINKSRSILPVKYKVQTGFEKGLLYPLGAPIEILPDDTFKLNLAALVRSGTLIAPILDDMFIDVFAFFVPKRIIWNHFQQFMGQNDDTAWTENYQYEEPQITIEFDGFTPQADFTGIQYSFLGFDYSNYWSYKTQLYHSLSTHFGLPCPTLQDGATDSDPAYLSGLLKVNHLPFRAYYEIWNDFFRDENITSPFVYSKGDGVSGDPDEVYVMYPEPSNNDDVFGNVYNWQYNSCLPVAKFHNLFTSLLPAPQAGAGVELPLVGKVPLIVGDDYKVGGIDLYSSSANVALYHNLFAKGNGKLYSDGASYTSSDNVQVDSTNLYADISKAAFTINQLRYSMMMQRWLEASARGGQGRYVELLRTHFGVVNSSAAHDRPQLLCQKRFAINIDQVVSTAETGEAANGALGDTGGYSITGFKTSLFTQTFTEHGYVLILYCVRSNQVYSQGIDKLWKKKNKFDYYWPEFDSIGEVAVMADEVNYKAANAATTPIGYQEAWYEYRDFKSLSTGYLDPNMFGSLNYWTISESYSGLVTLGSSLIYEVPTGFDRALTKNHELAPQFIMDAYIHGTAARPMSTHSIPGAFARL